MTLVTMHVLNAYQRKGDPVYSHSFHNRRALVLFGGIVYMHDVI